MRPSGWSGPGTCLAEVHGLDAAAYQARFDELTGQGYAPTILTATGPAGGAIFAAVFEQGVDQPWFARHALRWDPDTDPDTLTHENSRAYDQGYLPRCLAVYGDPSDGVRRRLGQEHRRRAVVHVVDRARAYQRFFDALVAGGMRPAALSVASDGFILSVFRGDQVGVGQARHGLTMAQYQSEFDARLAEGLRPIVVAAGGTGDGARYAAVFAADDTPTPRQWSVTGAGFAGAVGLDAAVRTFMVRHGIRAGSVAIGRDATILGARGYTWAEPGYPLTQPETGFRIASLSKIFAAAEASRLVAACQLTWTTIAFPFVGISSALPAGTPATPGMNAITVEQLVLRTSHLLRDFGPEQGRSRPASAQAPSRSPASGCCATCTGSRWPAPSPPTACIPMPPSTY